MPQNVLRASADMIPGHPRPQHVSSAGHLQLTFPCPAAHATKVTSTTNDEDAACCIRAVSTQSMEWDGAWPPYWIGCMCELDFFPAADEPAAPAAADDDDGDDGDDDTC